MSKHVITQCKNLTKRTSFKSVKVANMSLWFITQNTGMCRNDHLEKVLILWLSLLPNIDQAAWRAQARGENMAGVYERRNSSIWFNLFPTLFLFARQTPGVRLLGTLHCSARENNWENTLYILHTHTNSQNVLQISFWMLTRNVAATFVTDKFLLSWRRDAVTIPRLCVSGEPVF